ncbi:DedA protein [Vibrio astriarenae]|nr:DedA protein [Vibrio sp. C7]
MDMFSALITGDFDVVRSSKYLLLILAIVLFLESAFAFLPLPGDSLVLFAGGMIAVGVLDPVETAQALSFAASFGGLLAYWQGRALRNSKYSSAIERMLPEGALDRAKELLTSYGFLSLFISRFIPFVRVLTPMLMGVSRLNPWKMFFANISSCLLWMGLLLLLGKFTMLNPALEAYQPLMIKSLMGFSVTLMIIAILGVIARLIKPV